MTDAELIRHLWTHKTQDHPWLRDEELLIDRAEGVWVWTQQGKKLLDGFAGLAVVNVGHGRREIAESIAEQTVRLAYYPTTRQFSNRPAAELAAKLAALTPGDLTYSMFAVSGSEANERSMQIARHYWLAKGRPRKHKVISLTHGYHGATLGTLAICGQPDMVRAYEPLAWKGFRKVAAPYAMWHRGAGTDEDLVRRCADGLKDAIREEDPETVAAVILEPCLSSGGCIIPPLGWLERVRDVCDEFEVLMIADEVITGFGRTGPLFACAEDEVVPDLMTVAKGLTSGYAPMGAVLIADHVYQTIADGAGATAVGHGFTYSGHPTCCAVALVNIRGTGCSGGEFDLFSWRSALDGREVIEWIARQPWSNGDVAYYGHSYGGITGFMVAATRPPSLRAVSVSGLIDDIYRGIVYLGGVSNYGFPLLWTGGVRPAYDIGGGKAPGVYGGDPECARNVATQTRTILNDPIIQGLEDTDNTWMQVRSLITYAERINVPVHINGAYQDEQTGPRGPYHLFEKVTNAPYKRLLISNGNHGTQQAPVVERDRKAWLDHWMLGRGPRPARSSVRTLLEMVENRPTGIKDSRTFPLEDTRWTDLYLRDDGKLGRAAPRGEGGSDSYLYGTARQSWSYQAGHTVGAPFTTADGHDQLEYSTAEFRQHTAMIGPATATLYMSSTAPDTVATSPVLVSLIVGHGRPGSLLGYDRRGDDADDGYPPEAHRQRGCPARSALVAATSPRWRSTTWKPCRRDSCT